MAGLTSSLAATPPALPGSSRFQRPDRAPTGCLSTVAVAWRPLFACGRTLRAWRCGSSPLPPQSRRSALGWQRSSSRGSGTRRRGLAVTWARSAAGTAAPGRFNDRGQVVGVSATASRGRRFVLWEEGKPAVDLGPAPEGSGQPHPTERTRRSAPCRLSLVAGPADPAAFQRLRAQRPRPDRRHPRKREISRLSLGERPDHRSGHPPRRLHLERRGIDQQRRHRRRHKL